MANANLSAAFPAPRFLYKLSSLMPRGRPLSADTWHTLHRLVLFLLWLHAIGIVLFGIGNGFTPLHSLLEGGLVVAPALIASLPAGGRAFRSTVASFGLVTSSAVLTHLSGGYIEVHFHFFVVLAVIALYQQWIPFLLSIAYVAVHHGVFGAIDPDSVYNHPDAIANPWKWAVIHATFISAACAVYAVSWRLRERAEEAERAANARTANILASITDAFVALDKGRRLVSLNAAAETLLHRINKTPEDVMGKHLSEIFPGLAEIADYEQHQEVLSEATLVPFEQYYAPLDSWFEIRAYPSADGYSVFIHDVTQRRIAGEIVQDSERRNRELVEGLGAAVYTTDAAGRITHFNDAAAELWGRRPEIGKDLWCGSFHLFWADGTPMPHDECPMAVTLKENRAVRGEEAILERPDGTRINFLPFPTPLRDASGNLRGAVNLLVDITDLKRAKAALQESEERFRSIVNQTAAGVAQEDPAGNLVLVNDRFCELVGRSREELLNANVRDITHPDDVFATMALFERLAQGDSSGRLEKRYVLPDGTIVWADASIAAQRHAGGKLRYVTAVITDITARKAGDERHRFLARARDTLSASLDFTATLEGAASLAVPSLADFCAIHVFPTADSPARSATKHVDPAKEEMMRQLQQRYEPRPGEDHPLIQMMDTKCSVLIGDVDETKLRSIVRDDAHLDILKGLAFNSYMAVPLVAHGKLLGAMTFGIARPDRRYHEADVDLAEALASRVALALDNARLYEESQKLTEELRAAVEAKDEFVGMMSHELRTPITAILGGARLLRSRGERLAEETKADLLADIEGESERLARLVENLLVLARLELGEEVTTEPVLAQRTIEKLAASFEQRRPNRKLEVEVDAVLPSVAARQTYLEQVLGNLTANADKYCEPEGAIEIRAEQLDDTVEISVLDRGPGIAVEETDLIFERFYRSDQTSGKAAGSGLGLTVCKRLIEAQGGQIWARSREGGGLVVGFTLPLYKEDSQSDN